MLATLLLQPRIVQHRSAAGMYYACFRCWKCISSVTVHPADQSAARRSHSFVSHREPVCPAATWHFIFGLTHAQAPAATSSGGGRSAEMRLSAEFAPASHQLPPSPAASHRSAGSCPSPGAAASSETLHLAGGTDAASQSTAPQGLQWQAPPQVQQPEAAPAKPSPPPAAGAAAVGEDGADAEDGAESTPTDDAGAAEPVTPPQLPARHGRPVHSEDGGELQKANGADAASAGGESVTQAEGVAGVRGCCSSGAVAHQRNESGCAAVDPPQPPPPGPMSPYDRALAAHLAAASTAAAASDHSSDSGSSTISMRPAAVRATMAGGATLDGSCITARLPTDPVVHSLRGEAASSASAVQPATDATAVGSPASRADAGAAGGIQMPPPAGPVAQQPPQPDSHPIGRAAAGSPPAGRTPCSDGGSRAGSGKLPADGLRALAAQLLSPPPWVHPDALTPTGTTAQVCAFAATPP